MANRITRSIPNTLTCLNLFSGCIACVMAFEANYNLALVFIILSAVFDFFDGMMARLLVPGRLQSIWRSRESKLPQGRTNGIPR